MSSDTAKRRRVGEGGSGGDGIIGGGRSDNVGGGSDHQNDSSVHQDLREMKSKMDELINQNRKQTENISSMLQMMQSQSRDISQLTEANDTMQCDINRLTHAIDNIQSNQLILERKLKYQDILLQNQKWVYSAPRPSTDYLHSLNEDEGNDEREQAELFLEHIQQCTEEMRYGSGDGEIAIDANDVNSPNNVLQYNEQFLPHWKEFANALEQYQYGLKFLPEHKESTLRLSGMELPEEVIDLLSNALKSTYFHHFILRNNNITQKGIEFTLDYLESNPILKRYILVNNEFDSMDDIERLCQIVETHPSIEMLNLHGCKGMNVDDYEMLKMVMRAGMYKLDVLDLSKNGIGNENGQFVAGFMTNNHRLQVLDLSDNKLDDNDAKWIARSLKENTNLRTLNLKENNFTNTGWTALRKAELDDTSLNAASDSNHTCAIEYPSVEDDEEIEGVDTSEMNNNPFSQMHLDYLYVRQKKIYSVLSSRNRDCSNVKHFEDIPVELLPDILQSIQRYAKYHEEEDISQVRGHVQPLSIVYELCRHWEESLAAFETLSLSR